MAAKVEAPAFINSTVRAMISAACSSSAMPPNCCCQRSRYCLARPFKSGGFAIGSLILGPFHAPGRPVSAPGGHYSGGGPGGEHFIAVQHFTR
ncbi:MAG: hypothetical protein CMM60_05690 [Rhodospirillaceae bacterium]|nr:hypothetical protein [Rhodospirillaceae bacterium]